ncbi:polysaccharide biosynthesis protein [Paenibacillus aceti]|uniref:Polysaccharide biosynthesis protein n=1 Tax=Paenibacillus aceti TaxID=1820010 RepID=A0ABQ1VSV6_9BACL|nr:polysaccharide biosynthesis protein [Paenibacillus aceti]
MKFRRDAALLFLVDLTIIWFSIISSYWFRYYYSFPIEHRSEMFLYCIVATVCLGISLFYFRLYRRAWQYASIDEIVAIFKAVLVGGALSYVVALLLLSRPIPASVFFRSIETILLLVGGIRFVWRVVKPRGAKEVPSDGYNNVLIVGAGDCGIIIAKELRSSKGNMRAVGFIDDDPNKLHLQICGLPVLGNRDSIPEIVEKYKVKEIIISIPSATKNEISAIAKISKDTGALLKMIPRIDDLISGKVSLSRIREVSVEDLLGRDPIITDLDGIMNYVEHKVVLITGAGGSIGSELSRQIASYNPGRLLLLGHGENSIYTIEMELKRNFPELRYDTIIADIQDLDRMDQVFNSYRPQVVFHAAAHKHVPLMERNPAEAVKNNVFGTKNVADCADRYGVDRFVLISSDKAVNPTSVMGTTKRIAEMYIQSLNASSDTKFVAVRFGNVLGSRGSVIPHFKQQIKEGGPVTVTDPQMVRYFMTIPEAVQLVLQAGALAKGGEIFVLDMGDPVRILNLAEDLIRLSGYEPYAEIDIVFTGIREGEKLFEELLTDEENATSTQHNRIFIGKSSNLKKNQMELELAKLQKVIEDETLSVRDILERLVPRYEIVS